MRIERSLSIRTGGPLIGRRAVSIPVNHFKRDVEMKPYTRTIFIGSPDEPASAEKHAHQLDIETEIKNALKVIIDIACFTLLEHKTHLPTAVIHTFEGLTPVVLPFRSDEERKRLVERVKRQAIEEHAYAVTTITSASVVDSRTGDKTECLVLASTIQGGRPYIIVQHFTRDPEKREITLGDRSEGADAEAPGQMLIFPEWEEETKH